MKDTLKTFTVHHVYTLTASLIHGGFDNAATIQPFRREPFIQRCEDGNIMYDSLSIESNSYMNEARKRVKFLAKILWQSKGDSTRWTYQMLLDRMIVYRKTSGDLLTWFYSVLNSLGSTMPLFIDDEYEDFASILIAADSTLVFNLTGKESELMLIVASLQMDSRSRHAGNKQQINIFDLIDDKHSATNAPLTDSVKKVPLIANVPIVSGNTMRNALLRHHCARYLVETLNIKPGLEGIRNLFNGGYLKKGEKGIDIDKRKALTELIPIFGLFGGAFGQNNMIEGTLSQSAGLPVCKEVYHSLPESFGLREEARHLLSGELVAIEHYAARDPLLLLTSKYISQINNEKDKDELIGNGVLKNKNMPFEIETIKTGSRIYSRSTFHQATELQIGTFVSAFVQWKDMPILGAATNRGHGVCDMTMYIDDTYFMTMKNSSLVHSETSEYLFGLYREHITKNREEIKKELRATDG
jgi:hypothetical protein